MLGLELINYPSALFLLNFPRLQEGKDVVARAKTGSGKTFAYVLPLLQKLLSESDSRNKLAPSAFVLVPTRELCQQVYNFYTVCFTVFSLFAYKKKVFWL